MKTVSGKVVRQSLAYLSVHKWLLGDVPLAIFVKIWLKLIHLLENADFQSIFARIPLQP